MDHPRPNPCDEDAPVRVEHFRVSQDRPSSPQPPKSHTGSATSLLSRSLIEGADSPSASVRHGSSEVSSAAVSSSADSPLRQRRTGSIALSSLGSVLVSERCGAHPSSSSSSASTSSSSASSSPGRAAWSRDAAVPLGDNGFTDSSGNLTAPRDTGREAAVAALLRTPPPTPKGLGQGGFSFFGDDSDDGAGPPGELGAAPGGLGAELGGGSRMRTSKSHHNFGDIEAYEDNGLWNEDDEAARGVKRGGKTATIVRVSTVQNLTHWGIENDASSDSGTESPSDMDEPMGVPILSRPRQGLPANASISESLRD